MCIALLSDVHGNLAALEAVIADLERRSVDAVVDLGDLVSGPLCPRETAARLRATGWLHLAGNHERQLLTRPPESLGASDAHARAELGPDWLDWLATLPPSFCWSDDLFLCHGTPASDLVYLLETVDRGHARLALPEEIEERLGGASAAVVACGHTHIPRCVRRADGRLLVNPGSVGLQAYVGDYPHLHAMETGSPDARYAVLERRREGWQCELVAVPYDSRDMARLAAERGRPEWEHALLHGYVAPGERPRPEIAHG